VSVDGDGDGDVALNEREFWAGLRDRW